MRSPDIIKTKACNTINSVNSSIACRQINHLTSLLETHILPVIDAIKIVAAETTEMILLPPGNDITTRSTVEKEWNPVYAIIIKGSFKR